MVHFKKNSALVPTTCPRCDSRNVRTDSHDEVHCADCGYKGDENGSNDTFDISKFDEE